jgi:hypothetical protein
MGAWLALLLLGASLDVPFVPQTEALCGGAAAAMVLRYWGDAHADVQQFAPLVDKQQGGIPGRTLVNDLQRRGWTTIRFEGSMDTLAAQLGLSRPVIVLIEDRPGRYHFVVVTGINGSHVVVHDPARQPFREIPEKHFLRLWAASGFWALLILPGNAESMSQSNGVKPLSVPSSPRFPDGPTVQHASPAEEFCKEQLAETVRATRGGELETTDVALEKIRVRCPKSSAVLRELAGVRFARQHWSEATDLAAAAITAGDTDPYSWEVLASSRYMQDDLVGALEAWNHVGKPLINSVRIQGIRRTRYPIVDDALSLPVNALLTADAYRLAERRLQALPDELTARLRYAPESDGYVTVEVTFIEHPGVDTPKALGLSAARGAVERETRVDIPGTTGQGELWSINWRWWQERPKVAMSFAAPGGHQIPGVLRVETGYERAAFAVGQPISREMVLRESHSFGYLSASDWATPNLRYQWKTGIDAWNESRRAMTLGVDADQRFLNDRVSVIGGVAIWIPLTNGPGFKTFSGVLTVRSSPFVRSSWGFVADIGADSVTAGAPLSVWPAAGDSRTTARLMRAHPLFEDGIANGQLIGQRLTFGNAEVRRWFEPRWPIRVGVAASLDAGNIAREAPLVDGRFQRPFQLDAGAGLRIEVPGYAGLLRIDYGHGLRDDAHAITVGWQF